MKNYNDIYNDKEQMGRMMDTIYNKGYDKGYADRDEEIEDKVSDEYLEIEDAYHRGLADAWEYAKLLALPYQDGGMDYESIRSIFGNGASWQKAFMNYSAFEAIAKIKEYEEKKKAEDEIKVGDEVVNIENGNTHIITKIVKENYANYVDADGTVGFIDPVLYKKTGRHFDIQNIFEQMKGDNSNEN